MPPTVRVHPADTLRPSLSQAERAVHAAMKRGLPPGWTAWHSLRIRTKDGYLGEGDFVLAHPEHGLLALEVKGGRIEQRDGVWRQNGVLMEQSPLDQAHGFLRKLTKRLSDDGCQAPAFGAAVCFPDIDFDRPPTQDDLAGVVITGRELQWFSEALPPVAARALPAPGQAVGAWIDRIHRYWGESTVSALSLGTRVSAVNEQRFELDPLQLLALDNLLASDRLLVQGGAGSGKTLLAAEAARRAAERGEKVLLLCFTAPLQRFLAARLEGTGVEVHTVSGFAKQLVDAADGAVRFEDPFDSNCWNAALLRASEVCEQRWDTVVVDEAQDLQDEAWYLVEGLARGKRLWGFHDPAQTFWQNRKPPAELFGRPFLLTRGQRCPPGIQDLANVYAGAAYDEGAIRKAQAEGTLKLLQAPSASSVQDKVGDEVDRLLGAGLAPSDIAIVSLRGQTAAGTIYESGQVGRHSVARADAPDAAERLVADSFLRWKGLERPAVIVADLPDGELAQRGVRTYVALTRALVAVRVVAPRERLALDPVLRRFLEA
ncbi:nuclease-related domain-containing DEAD/DEAH box helicase [Anaeromyxobacter paludicola]|uniref:DNA 3'-5' helicase II n=1 Tax=Anaeromyxobacter paludicola TaxID=2918171 RepID=A0ABM7X9W3_9BACT|nr:NERD domain-containing protein [Anaeromyxobacter paludicola]BDG08600.1 nuclease [Anaeromyxobacter paludicola]